MDKMQMLLTDSRVPDWVQDAALQAMIRVGRGSREGLQACRWLAELTEATGERAKAKLLKEQEQAACTGQVQP